MTNPVAAVIEESVSVARVANGISGPIAGAIKVQERTTRSRYANTHVSVEGIEIASAPLGQATGVRVLNRTCGVRRRGELAAGDSADYSDDASVGVGVGLRSFHSSGSHSSNRLTGVSGRFASNCVR